VESTYVLPEFEEGAAETEGNPLVTADDGPDREKKRGGLRDKKECIGWASREAKQGIIGEESALSEREP